MNFGVVNNHEYPEIIVSSIPVPDFISDTEQKDKALKLLKLRIRQLSKLPITCFGVACNTAHLVLPDLQRQTNIPFVSMIEMVVEEVCLKGYRRVGLLASPTTIESGLYSKPLQAMGIKVITPSQNEIIEMGEIIKSVISGENIKSKQKLLVIAQRLKMKKIDALILGCTELPLVFPKRFAIPVINSAQTLANALVKRYYEHKEVL